MTHVWVPKLKLLEAELVAPVGGVAGFFMVEALNRYGHVTRKLGPWKQLITNQVMDFLFYFSNDGIQSGPHGRARVGTGSPTFVNGSTGLANSIAQSVTISAFSNTVDAAGTNSYRERHTVTADFGLGNVVGNLTEVGFFNGSTNADGAFLDLIRDAGGTPTTFPVTVNDQLRVTHIFDRYPFLGTTSGTFTVGGSAGSGNHDYTSSMGNLTNGNGNTNGGNVFGVGNNSSQSWDLSAWRDVTALGANTAGLTGGVLLGTASSSSGGLGGTASNDGTTWSRAKTWTFGLTDANHANGISGLSFASTGTRGLKFFITPSIPKFAGSIQRILTLQGRYGITRV